jgi:hypothetical protein
MLGRLPAAMRCLSFLLMTAAPLQAARALSEMSDTAAHDSVIACCYLLSVDGQGWNRPFVLCHRARCQSSGAALGSQAYKECRALLESKMSIEKDVPPDRGYTGRWRN